MLPTRHTLPRLLLALGLLLTVLPATAGAQDGPRLFVTTPAVALRAASPVVGDTAWVTVTWSRDGAQDARRFELQQRVDGGPWRTLTLRPTFTTRRSVQLAAGSRAQFRVRGIAASGLAGVWAEGPVISLAREATSPGAASDGALALASVRASSSVAVQGTSVALAARRGPSGGPAEVRIDGALVATIDLFALTPKPERVMFSRAGLDNAQHTVEIRSLHAGTPPASVSVLAVQPAPVVLPVQLRIPAIQVDAPATPRGVSADGVMEAPAGASEVAWYDFSGTPGWPGNIVFAGHVSYQGVGPAVFWSIDTLKAGDALQVVGSDGVTYDYRVTTTFAVPENAHAADIVGETPTEMVTLITCTGSFDTATRHYSQRLVVRAERVTAP